MPDTFVDIGLMSFNKDPKKVPTKHTPKARMLMRNATMKVVRATPGFTPDKVGNPSGYHVDATLDSIEFGTYQGQPSVTCKMTGVVATYPEKRWLTQKLTGKATLAGGTTDRDVDDCISAAMEATVKDQVMPFLKKKP